MSDITVSVFKLLNCWWLQSVLGLQILKFFSLRSVCLFFNTSQYGIFSHEICLEKHASCLEKLSISADSSVNKFNICLWCCCITRIIVNVTFIHAKWWNERVEFQWCTLFQRQMNKATTNFRCPV